MTKNKTATNQIKNLKKTTNQRSKKMETCELFFQKVFLICWEQVPSFLDKLCFTINECVDLAFDVILKQSASQENIGVQVSF